MLVPVMNVGVMRVAVPDRLMLVNVAVGFAAIPFKVMLMLMVFIVNMPVTMDERLVLVVVRVAFSEVNPDANAHQQGGDPERQ